MREKKFFLHRQTLIVNSIKRIDFGGFWGGFWGGEIIKHRLTDVAARTQRGFF